MIRSVPLLVVVLGLLVVASGQAAPPVGDAPPFSAATCTISQQCSDGSTVSCSGANGTCTSGSNWVQCDGTRHTCPSTSCEAQVTCAYGGLISCTSNTYCEEGTDYVYCDGAGTLTCDQCFPAIWCSIP